MIPKNCVDNFTDYKTVVASRGGLSYYDVMQWSEKHPLLQQTEWSDVPDDTEWDVPGLSTTEAAPQEIALPLNDREMYRIKRALLRYEVLCALFYLRPDRYFDTRLHPRRSNPIPDSSRRRAFREDQVIFLKEYVNPWEVGELAVITQFMYDLVRYVAFNAKGCLFTQHLGFQAYIESRKGTLALLWSPIWLNCSLLCREQGMLTPRFR